MRRLIPSFSKGGRREAKAQSVACEICPHFRTSASDSQRNLLTAFLERTCGDIVSSLLYQMPLR